MENVDPVGAGRDEEVEEGRAAVDILVGEILRMQEENWRLIKFHWRRRPILC